MIPWIGHRPSRTQTQQNKPKLALAVPGKRFSAVAIQDWMLLPPAAFVALASQCSARQLGKVSTSPHRPRPDQSPSCRRQRRRRFDPRHEAEGLFRPQPPRVRRRPRSDSPRPDGRLLPRLHGGRRLRGKLSQNSSRFEFEGSARRTSNSNLNLESVEQRN